MKQRESAKLKHKAKAKGLSPVVIFSICQLFKISSLSAAACDCGISFNCLAVFVRDSGDKIGIISHQRTHQCT